MASDCAVARMVRGPESVGIIFERVEMERSVTVDKVPMQAKLTPIFTTKCMVIEWPSASKLNPLRDD